MIRASLALPSRSARWTCAARYQPAGTASATVKPGVEVLKRLIRVTPPASPAKARRHPSNSSSILPGCACAPNQRRSARGAAPRRPLRWRRQSSEAAAPGRGQARPDGFAGRGVQGEGMTPLHGVDDAHRNQKNHRLSHGGAGTSRLVNTVTRDARTAAQQGGLRASGCPGPTSARGRRT